MIKWFWQAKVGVIYIAFKAAIFKAGSPKACNLYPMDRLRNIMYSNKATKKFKVLDLLG